jgi:tetratricopeptide (TPR) repeat protein
MARRHRGPLAGFLIFAGTLFPVLGFLNVYPFRYSYVADHFQYLAGLGVIVPAASGLALIAHRVSAGKSWGIGIASAFVAILGFESWQQCHIYRDAETLYRETLVRNPKNWMAYNNLGHVLAQAPERLPDAIAEYEKALQIRADVPEIHLSLAGALAQMPGRTEEAVAQYKIALRMKPDYWEAHLSFAKLLSHLPGRLTEAIPEYEAALRSKPDSTVGHLNLGNVYVQLPGRLPDAIAEYEAALKIWPDYAEAHYNLGSALAQIPGRTAEAVAQFQAALRSKPDLESARQAIEILSENSR